MFHTISNSRAEFTDSHRFTPHTQTFIFQEQKTVKSLTDFCDLSHEAFHMSSVISLTIKEVEVTVNPGGGEQGEGKDQDYT